MQRAVGPGDLFGGRDLTFLFHQDQHSAHSWDTKTTCVARTGGKAGFRAAFLPAAMGEGLDAPSPGS